MTGISDLGARLKDTIDGAMPDGELTLMDLANLSMAWTMNSLAAPGPDTLKASTLIDDAFKWIGDPQHPKTATAIFQALMCADGLHAVARKQRERGEHGKAEDNALMASVFLDHAIADMAALMEADGQRHPLVMEFLAGRAPCGVAN